MKNKILLIPLSIALFILSFSGCTIYPCSECNGTGTIYCDVCYGYGYIAIERTCGACDGEPNDNRCAIDGTEADCSCQKYADYCSCDPYSGATRRCDNCNNVNGWIVTTDENGFISITDCPKCDNGDIKIDCNRCNRYEGCDMCGEDGTVTSYYDCSDCVATGKITCSKCNGLG